MLNTISTLAPSITVMNWQLISASVIITTSLLTLSNGQNPSVSLTVDGGVSLVGPHCPGTVRLVCEGVDLTFLQWTFNDSTTTTSTEIETFVPDDIPSVQTNTNNPAFLSVELTSITRNGVLANYVSILTPNLTLLQSENVVEIACGAGPTVVDRVPVNVEIIRLSAPETPNITEVIANYNSSSLTSVEVVWMTLDTLCLESLYYEVSLTSGSPVRANHTSCSQPCFVKFEVDTVNEAGYEVVISASNSVGSSGISVYQQRIEQTSNDYFVSEVAANVSDSDCQIQGRCVSAASLNTTCSVRYTQDPMFNGSFSETRKAPFVFADLSPETTYYLEFSATVNESLQLRIINRLKTSTDQCTTQLTTAPSPNVHGTAVAVSVPVLIVIILVVVVVSVLVTCIASRKKQGYYIEQSSEVEKVEMETVEITIEQRHASTQTVVTGKLKSAIDALKKSTSQQRGYVTEKNLVELWPAEPKKYRVPFGRKQEAFRSLPQVTDTQTQTENHDSRFPPLKRWPKGSKSKQLVVLMSEAKQAELDLQLHYQVVQETAFGEYEKAHDEALSSHQPKHIASNQQMLTDNSAGISEELQSVDTGKSRQLSGTTPTSEQDTAIPHSNTDKVLSSVPAPILGKSSPLVAESHAQANPDLNVDGGTGEAAQRLAKIVQDTPPDHSEQNNATVTENQSHARPDSNTEEPGPSLEVLAETNLPDTHKSDVVIH